MSSLKPGDKVIIVSGNSSYPVANTPVVGTIVRPSKYTNDYWLIKDIHLTDPYYRAWAQIGNLIKANEQFQS